MRHTVKRFYTAKTHLRHERNRRWRYTVRSLLLIMPRKRGMAEATNGLRR